jgi:hypothetical protein
MRSYRIYKSRHPSRVWRVDVYDPEWIDVRTMIRSTHLLHDFLESFLSVLFHGHISQPCRHHSVFLSLWNSTALTHRVGTTWDNWVIFDTLSSQPTGAFFFGYLKLLVWSVSMALKHSVRGSEVDRCIITCFGSLNWSLDRDTGAVPAGVELVQSFR